MLASPLVKPISLAGVALLWIGVPTMMPWSTGTWASSPNAASGASCSGCHASAAPSINSSRTSLVADAGVHALSPGQAISVTTSLDASGANQTLGGFLSEADAGSFTAGANTQTGSTGGSSIAVSHIDSSSRSWTYTFNAPATAGLVELTAAGLSPNGDGQAFGVVGDHMSFSGYDKTATSATPLRLYVLPNGVTNIGTACPDAYGNVPVLGANEEPNPGDAGFELRLHGAAPGEAAFLWGAIGAGGFNQSLNSLGLTGCSSYIQNVDATQIATTSAGSAQRGDGSVAFALPIPNNPTLIGTTYHFQAGYCDPSVNSGFAGLPNGSPVLAAARSLDLSLTNALEVTVQ